jgi:hypothetical protein
VHCLDLHYFYRGDLDLYLLLLWRSWSCVPSVYSDLPHYISRCLLAIATKGLREGAVGGSQPTMLQFEDCVNRLVTFIRARLTSAESAVIAHEVTGILENTIARNAMEREFDRALPVIWATAKYLYFRPIALHLETGHIANASIVDENYQCPPFENGDLLSNTPISPISFLLSYLTADIPDDEDPLLNMPESKTCWMLAIAASCYKE